MDFIPDKSEKINERCFNQGESTFYYLHNIQTYINSKGILTF